VAHNGQSAVAKARALRPDVILLDLRLQEQAGVELIGVLSRDNEDTRIVILTAYADDREVAMAFRSGAVGYVLKTQAVSDLVRAIEHAHAGLSSVPPRVAKIMLQTLNSATQSTPDGGRLSDAEVRVLTYVARGLQNKEIARHLGISRPTVHAHISRILSKLQLENRTQAAVYAVKQGFATLDMVDAQFFDWQQRTLRN
jgi:DNA-binding NarL/FixJ family response regulator